MVVLTPKVIRADLPSPDAVIVRQPTGELVVVADHRVNEQFVQQLVREAPHVRDGRAFGPPHPRHGVA